MVRAIRLPEDWWNLSIWWCGDRWVAQSPNGLFACHRLPFTERAKKTDNPDAQRMAELLDKCVEYVIYHTTMHKEASNYADEIARDVLEAALAEEAVIDFCIPLACLLPEGAEIVRCWESDQT